MLLKLGTCRVIVLTVFGAIALTGERTVLSEPTTAATIFERKLKSLEARKVNDPRAKIGNNTTYNLLKVKVEDWLATEEGRFAHALKIPNPVPADSGYRKGMTQQQYFEHLCKREAGEFIFKTADNVEGIYQLRPRKMYTDWEWQHLYAVEDPYGHAPWEADDPALHLLYSTLYSYFELPASGRRLYGAAYRKLLDPSLLAPTPANAAIARYFGYDNRSGKSMKLRFDTEPMSRYGFTWRGIKRPHDRELGIAGGELIVIDLKSNEILAVRRGYATWNHAWTGRVCPRYGYSGGEDKTTYHSAVFIAKVVRPPRWAEFFSEKEKGRVAPR